jgi:hypothetical protein
VDLDRQSIERRDFPIGRRGYDPAAVDAHLHALAAEVQELQRELSERGGGTLAATASTQVQGIVRAAEVAAADIERQAQEAARRAREEADRDAERTRADAVKRAQAHGAAVAQAAAALLARVEAMDGEASTLVESLHAGAGRLAQDLAAVERDMGELYDAAGRAGDPAGAGLVAAKVTPAPTAPSVAPPIPVPAPEPAPVVRPTVTSMPAPAPAPSAAEPTPSAPRQPAPTPPTASNGDLDGARLIALNMALNGEPRADADRFLAENYELEDRQKLLDEVYAAIEG